MSMDYIRFSAGKFRFFCPESAWNRAAAFRGKKSRAAAKKRLPLPGMTGIFYAAGAVTEVVSTAVSSGRVLSKALSGWAARS